MSLRRVYIDYINVLAMVFVIYQHTRIAFYDPVATQTYWAEIVVSSVAVCAVPLFLMNSGANLFDYLDRYDTWTFLRKRALKIVIPYLVWTQVYIAAESLRGNIDGLGEWFEATINPARVCPPLWYLEVLVGLYLFVPVLAYALKALGEARRTGATYLLVILVVGTMLLPLVRVHDGSILGQLNVPASGYLVFMVAGYLLSRSEPSLGVRIGSYAAGLGGIAAFIVLGSKYSLAHSPLGPFFVGYLTFGTLATSAAIFIAAQRVPVERWTRASRVIRYLSGLTFGIYLVHYGILAIFQALRPIGGALDEAAYTAACWCLSALLVAGARTIGPVRRWILP